MSRVLLAALLLLPAAASAVPLEFQHQGRIMDALGAPLAGPHTLDVAIYDVPTGGAALWSDTITTTFDNGFFAVPLTALNEGDYDGSDLYLGMAVDSGSELPSRVKLASVPYAIMAGGVEGGAVDASSISVNGSTVINTAGEIQWGSVVGAPADNDTLAGVTGCSNGDVLTYSAGSWACGAASWDASTITSGVLSISSIPVGNTSGTVAAGDHVHDGSHITGGTIDIGVLPTGVAATEVALGNHSHGGGEDGSSQALAAYSCEAILDVVPRAPSGVYWFDLVGDGSSVWQGHCDMDTEGGGWLDLVKTYHISGQDTDALTATFFAGGGTLTGIADTNASAVDGILITTDEGGHNGSVHLKPDDLRYSSVRSFWRLQGSDENYRCTSSNWIPLNGPGYNGNCGGSYQAACVAGYNCIQGACTSSRDAPISATYNSDAMTSSNTLLTWSTSYTGPPYVSLNCSRDVNIPLDEPALFFETLLLR